MGASGDHRRGGIPGAGRWRSRPAGVHPKSRDGRRHPGLPNAARSIQRMLRQQAGPGSPLSINPLLDGFTRPKKAKLPQRPTHPSDPVTDRKRQTQSTRRTRAHAAYGASGHARSRQYRPRVRSQRGLASRPAAARCLLSLAGCAADVARPGWFTTDRRQ
jgi:hypothetical protein